MLNLPAHTQINKPLSKKSIYDKFGLKNSVRDNFDVDVSRITIVNEISQTTVSIANGDQVFVIYVLHILLKQDKFDEKNIILLSNLIEQRIIFVLECEEQAKLAVFEEKLHVSDWKPLNELSLELRGVNLDRVWENIVCTIGGFDIEQGKTLVEQIVENKRSQKIERQITTLERQARAEKQPKRKFELVQEIKKLEKER